MTQHKLQNSSGDTVIVNGERIAYVNTDDGDKLRWIELSVFERDAGGFVYYTVGKSVVFHRIGDDYICGGRGVPVRAGDLNFDRLEPCNECQPEQHPGPDEMVRREVGIHTLKVCDSLTDVINAARVRGEITGPTRQLIAQFAPRQKRTISL